MKNTRYIFYFFLISLITQCGQHAPKLLLTGNIEADLNALLKPGETEVQVMDSIVQSPREMELMYRLQQATNKNSDWYNEYLEAYKAQRVPPYHANFGLSEVEYNELVNLKLNLVLVPSSSYSIQIVNEHGVITFKTAGRMPYLENIKIFTQANAVSVSNYTLHFSDTIFVANENHALKSMWKGYTWNYDEPSATDTLSDFISIKHYSISIGQLYKSGKTLITINESESYDGESTLKIEKPLVLTNN